MSYSFLDSLWDTEGNSAYTSEPSNPSGRRYVGGTMGQTQPIQPGTGGPPQQEQESAAPSYYAPEQSYGMAPVQQTPPMPHAGAGMEHGAGSSRKSGGFNNDPNAEMKALLRATLGQLYENYKQQHQKLHELKEGRGKMTKNLENLTYVVYALLALCVVMAILLILLCYKTNLIQKVVGANAK